MTASSDRHAAAPLLQAEGLHAAYGSAAVLHGVSLQLQAGEVVGLLGRNGMGKTTLVRTLMGVQVPTAGHVSVLGQPLAGLPSHAIARLGLALVPEGRQIFPNLTVRENLVATAANRRGEKEPWTLDRVFDLFSNLKNRSSNFGNQLSGGEQQMLAIGRALMTNPRLLILDEATEGLAPLIRVEIYRSIEKLKAAGLSILVIDKDVKALTRIADVHYMLEKGRVVWTGDSAQLAANVDVQHRYLGV